MPHNIPQLTLGWRMRLSLASSDFSVKMIAADLGVSRSTVSKWLGDQGAPPRRIYLVAWADRTGVPFGWLETGAEPDPSRPCLVSNGALLPAG